MSESNPESSSEPVAAAAQPISLDDILPKMQLTGTVKRLELYGAFVDIGTGTNALIHISKLGSDQVNRVSDVLAVGDEITVWVDRVDRENNQVMVTMVEPLAVEWGDLKNGQEYKGIVRRLENYGAFVDIGAEREGLVHISELSHDYVKDPSEVLSVGQEVDVQVLGFSRRKRRIDLSMKTLQEKPAAEVARAVEQSEPEPEEDAELSEEMPTAMEMALRKAMGDQAVDEMLPDEDKGGGRGRKFRRRSAKRRQQQEEVLSRTLQLHAEDPD